MQSKLATLALAFGVIALCAEIAGAAAQTGPASPSATTLFIGPIAYDPPQLPAGVPPDLTATRETGVFVVQYEWSKGQKVYDALVGQGLRIVQYLRNDGLIVAGERSASDLAAIEGVTHVILYHAVFKLSRPLYEDIGRAGADPDERLALTLELFEPPIMDLGALTAELNRIGATSEREYLPFVDITVPRGRIAQVAGVPSVRTIEETVEEVCDMDVAAGIGRIPTTGWAPPDEGGFGLSGLNQIIEITDSGLDNAQECDGLNACTQANPNIHPDLRGRLHAALNLTNPGQGVMDTVGHGTHVVGIALGNGEVSRVQGHVPPISGVAYRANLVFIKRTNTTTWVARLLAGSVRDARIHSASCGSRSTENYSDQTDGVVDDFLRTHPNEVAVKSAGNFGPLAGTLTRPGRAKNIITVANSENVKPVAWNQAIPGAYADNPSQLRYRSSSGPAVVAHSNRGRLKPDITAPGTAIASIRSSMAQQSPDPVNPWQGNFPYPGAGVLHDRYTYKSGTSMAAPYVAGTLALLREYLQTYKGLQTPPGALLKSLLLNGAIDMSGTAGDYKCQTVLNRRCPDRSTDIIPSADQGWGRLNLTQVLKPCAERQCTVLDGLGIDLYGQPAQFTQNGQEKLYRLRLARKQPVIATLSWYDSRGEQLINDLDISLRLRTSNDTFWGGVPSFTPAGGVQSDGRSHPNRPRDRVNAVEKLVLNPPEDGFYDVSVIAHNIAPGTMQSFGLALSGLQGADSADLYGNYTYTFRENQQPVQFRAVGLPADATVEAYVIEHDPNLDFLGPNPIVLANTQVKTHVPATADAAGEILLAPLWPQPTRGGYNIVIDVNRDGTYQRDTDVVDYATQPGFFVEPARKRRIVTVGVQTGRAAKRQRVGQPIKASGKGLPGKTESHLYITRFGRATNWNRANIAELAIDIPNNPLTVSTSPNGDFGPVTIWNNPTQTDVLTYGSKFQLVLDVNRNGVFEPGVDVLDAVEVGDIGIYISLHNALEKGNRDVAVKALNEMLNVWYESQLDEDDDLFDEATEDELFWAMGEKAVSRLNDLYDRIYELAEVGFIVQPESGVVEDVAYLDRYVDSFGHSVMNSTIVVGNRNHWSEATINQVDGITCDTDTYVMMDSGFHEIGGQIALGDCSLYLSSSVGFYGESDRKPDDARAPSSRGIVFMPGTQITVSPGGRFQAWINP